VLKKRQKSLVLPLIELGGDLESYNMSKGIEPAD
jgi:hypothetical protein